MPLSGIMASRGNIISFMVMAITVSAGLLGRFCSQACAGAAHPCVYSGGSASYGIEAICGKLRHGNFFMESVFCGRRLPAGRAGVFPAWRKLTEKIKIRSGCYEAGSFI